MVTDVHTDQIDVSEFRENLDHFLASHAAVGEVIGVYTPLRQGESARVGEADTQALRTAGQKVDAMLAAAGIGEREAIREAEEILRGRKRKSTSRCWFWMPTSWFAQSSENVIDALLRPTPPPLDSSRLASVWSKPRRP
jgi:hypothetical protein